MYFGVMFFKLQAQVFFATDNFPSTYVDFCFITFVYPSLDERISTYVDPCP